MNTHKKTVKFFIVQSLSISNKEAIEIIGQKRVMVNGAIAGVNQSIGPCDEVRLDDKVLKAAKELVYLAVYKPRGVETTLNNSIRDNLYESFDLAEGLFPVGRLDKESEGLLLLTNDGRLYQKITHSENHQEKEYRVTVDKPLTEEAIQRLSSGIKIIGKMTRPAMVGQIDEYTFAITLTQGLNRQIRRMCYKLGYEVTRLVRVRIVNIVIGEMKPGEVKWLNEKDVFF
ncbi:MAG: pseudouridine synthase [Cytophagaceae bacterium]